MARWAHLFVLGLAIAACGRATLDLEEVSSNASGTAGTKPSGAGGAGQAGRGGSDPGGRGGTAGSGTAGSGGSAGGPREWQEPIAIGNEPNYGYAPAVAIDDAGNAFVAWRENSPTYQILASRFAAATNTWGVGQVIPFASGLVNFVTVGFGDTGVPHVAMWRDELGVELGAFDPAIAAWQVTTLPTPQDDRWLGVPAIAGTGRIAAVWGENPNLGGDITALWSGRYNPIAGWSAPERLQVSGVDRFNSAWIDASPNGHAGAILQAVFGNRLEIWAAAFNAVSATWTTPLRIDAAADVKPREAIISVDDSGNLMAIWVDDASTIMTRRYSSNAGGWLTREPVGNGAYPRVSVDESGNAIAVWVEGSPRRIAWSRRVNGSWQPRLRLFADMPGDHYEPDVAMNAAGQAVAAWSIRTDPTVVPVVWVSRLE